MTFGEIVEELLPFIKAGAVIYGVLFFVVFSIALAFIIWVWRWIIKDHREFDERWHDRRW
jgi:hypothetical protein